MIDETLILKEIDEWTDILNRNIERRNQVSSGLMEVCLLERELATYQRVKNLVHYSTESEKEQ